MQRLDSPRKASPPQSVMNDIQSSDIQLTREIFSEPPFQNDQITRQEYQLTLRIRGRNGVFE